MLGLGNSVSALPSSSLFSGGGFAVNLDGTNDHVSVAYDSSILPTAAITYSSWVNLDSGATGWVNPDGDDDHNEYIIGCIKNGGYSVRLTYDGTAANPKTKIEAEIRVDNTGSGSAGYLRPLWGGVVSTTGSTALHEIKDFSGWIHIAVTFDGRYARLYVNGSNDLNTGAVDTSGTQVVDSGGTGRVVVYASNSAVQIGADINHATNETTVHNYLIGGKIDEVAIWDAAVDAAGILKIYNSGTPGLDLTSADGDYDNEGDLQGYWKFNEGTGTTVTDSSSNSNTGTFRNSPSWVETDHE